MSCEKILKFFLFFIFLASSISLLSLQHWWFRTVDQFTTHLCFIYCDDDMVDFVLLLFSLDQLVLFLEPFLIFPLDVNVVLQVSPPSTEVFVPSPWPSNINNQQHLVTVISIIIQVFIMNSYCDQIVSVHLILC